MNVLKALRERVRKAAPSWRPPMNGETQRTATCANCGGRFTVEHLDGKPQSLAGLPATFDMLTAAADRGEDFDVLECAACYGPAWMPMKGLPHAR